MWAGNKGNQLKSGHKDLQFLQEEDKSLGILSMPQIKPPNEQRTEKLSHHSASPKGDPSKEQMKTKILNKVYQNIVVYLVQKTSNMKIPKKSSLDPPHHSLTPMHLLKYAFCPCLSTQPFFHSMDRISWIP